MDIHIVFLNENTSLMDSYYLGSEFMGYASHKESFDDFKRSNEGVDILYFICVKIQRIGRM